MNHLISTEKLESIEILCKKYNLKGYTIQNDGKVNVTGYVDLSDLNLTELPISFNEVSNNFNIFGNNLTSLAGSPVIVGGDFNCNYNNLTTLEHSPKHVGGTFDCSSNKLTSLEHSPLTVFYDFNCKNTSIPNLIGISKILKGGITCGDRYLTSFEGAPKEINGSFRCINGYNTSLQFSPESVGGTFYMNNLFKLTSIVGFPKSVGYGTIIKDCVNLNNTMLPTGDYTNSEGLSFINTALPKVLDKYDNFNLLFKYQNYYDIWNDDGTLNIENFNEFELDVKDGLE